MVRNWLRDAMVPRSLRGWADEVRGDTFAIASSLRDRRTPLLAKVLGAAVVAYAFSPIDLIPDFIPVVGYLDDLVLVPIGLRIVRSMIPAEVLAEHRVRAARTSARVQGVVGAGFVGSVGAFLVGFVMWWFGRR
ncbi:MAG: DUF1232 domain-containing protein [Chloroflexi bacterium]|nr:MAG: DUF1232 domain-containing protein [Chloroflexota bacterium]